jgi:hypothetical protein
MNMDLWKTLRILVRRWPVVLVMFALTAAGLAATLRAVPPTYEERSSLLLLIPPFSGPVGQREPANPYLSFGGSLTTTAQIMVSAMNQDTTVTDALKRDGARAAFQVLPDPFGESPSLTIVVTDKDPKMVSLTVGKVLDATKKELASRQEAAGAPSSLWIVAKQVIAPGKPRLLRSGQLRAGAAVGALGLVLTILAAMAVEGLARTRAARRSLPVSEPSELPNERAWRPAGATSNGESKSPALSSPHHS